MLDAALNDWQVMKTLKRSVTADPATDAALKRVIMDRAPDPSNTAKFREWLDGHSRVLRQAFTPEHLANLQKIARVERDAQSGRQRRRAPYSCRNR
jgi:hypothetical protein